jgi:hypothetical protein
MPPKITVAPRLRANRPTRYPRSALPVWMPIPTASPGSIVAGSNDSTVSSQRIGSPKRVGVAAAKTNSHRGVMTAVPKAVSLGLTIWIRTRMPLNLQLYVRQWTRRMPPTQNSLGPPLRCRSCPYLKMQNAPDAIQLRPFIPACSEGLRPNMVVGCRTPFSRTSSRSN